MDPINLPKFSILCLGVTLTSIFIFRITDAMLFMKNRFILVLIMSYLLSLFFVTLINKNDSIYLTLMGNWARYNGIIFYVLMLILFVLSTIMSSNFHSDLGLSSTLSFLGGCLAIYGWFQINGNDPISLLYPWYNESHQLVLTLGNSNYASVFIGISSSASLYSLLKYESKIYPRILHLTLYLIQSSLIPRLDTQGKIIFGLSSVLVFGFYLQSMKSLNIKFASYLYWGASFIIGLLGLLGLFGKGYFAGVLSDNVRTLSDRTFAWMAAIEMIKDYPLTGVGVDNFNSFYRLYRDPAAYELVTNNPYNGYDNAHNVFLNVGSTFGLIFLVSFLVIVLYVSLIAIRLLKVEKSFSYVHLSIAIWFSYILQSLVSLDQISISIWAWASAGLIVGLYLRRKYGFNSHIMIDHYKLTAKEILISSIAVFMICFVLLPALLNENSIYRTLIKYPKVASDSGKETVLEELFRHGEKSKQMQLKLTVIQYLIRGGKLNLATDLARDGANKFPGSFDMWDIFSRLLADQGKLDEALKAAETAKKLDPRNKVFKEFYDNLIQMNQ